MVSSFWDSSAAAAAGLESFGLRLAAREDDCGYINAVHAGLHTYRQHRRAVIALPSPALSNVRTTQEFPGDLEPSWYAPFARIRAKRLAMAMSSWDHDSTQLQ